MYFASLKKITSTTKPDGGGILVSSTSFHLVQLIGLPVRLATELGSVAGMPAMVEN